MRKSNWKSTLLLIVAVILAVGAAIMVALFLPEKYELYRGLLAFGSIPVVAGIVLFIGFKIFKIGRD